MNIEVVRLLDNGKYKIENIICTERLLTNPRTPSPDLFQVINKRLVHDDFLFDSRCVLAFPFRRFFRFKIIKWDANRLGWGG